MRKIRYDYKALARIFGKNKRNISKIKKAFDVEIKIDKEITVKASKGDKAIKEYLVDNVLQALALGFDIESALLLKDMDYVFKIIDLRNYARGSRLNTIVSRLIGRRGKAKKVIEELSKCRIVVSDHKVGIIGKAEHIEIATMAIEKLIRGSPHAKVFRFLERSKGYLEEQEKLIEELQNEI